MGFVGALLSQQFAETDVARGFVNGFNFNGVASGHAGSQAIGFMTPQRAPWGRDHHAWFRRHFGHGLGVFAIGDDLPQPGNRVTLSGSERDADGLPAPKIAYATHENDRRMMRFALDRLADIARAAGAFDYRLHDYRSPEGVYQTPAWHLLVTCRMGATQILRRRQMEPQLGRPQPLYRRRQRARHRRRGEPDADDLRAGAALRGEPAPTISRCCDRPGRVTVPPAQSVSTLGIAMRPAALAASAAQVGPSTRPGHRRRRAALALLALAGQQHRACRDRAAATSGDRPPCARRARRSRASAAIAIIAEVGALAAAIVGVVVGEQRRQHVDEDGERRAAIAEGAAERLDASRAASRRARQGRWSPCRPRREAPRPAPAGRDCARLRTTPSGTTLVEKSATTGGPSATGKA